MRRRPRVVRSSLTAVSLLLCVGVGVLWVRSYTRMDGLQRCAATAAGARSYSVYTRHGSVHYLFVAGPQGAPPGWRHLGAAQPPMFKTISDRPKRRLLGLAYGDASAGNASVWCVSVPCWLLLGGALCPSFVWAWRRRRRRIRRRRGLCLNCGYDLRGMPGRCPECGAAAEVTPA
jgi:hypothetical protein